MKKLHLIWAFIFVGNFCFSQETRVVNIDSLLMHLNASQEGAKTVDAYTTQISKFFSDGLPPNKKALLYFINSTVNKAQELNDVAGLAEANYHLGRFYISGNSSYSKAIPALLESLSGFEKLKDSLGVSKCYMQLGLIGYTTQYFEDGIKNFKLSLKYYDYPISTYLMAITYTELEKYDEAKKNFLKAIGDFKKTNKTYNLNECYMYLGNLYERENKFDSAYYYLQLSIRNQKKLNNLKDLSRPYALISGYYLKTDALDSAEYYALEALRVGHLSDDKLSAVIATKTLSLVYEEENEFEKAHHYLKEHYNLKNESLQGSTKQKIAEMQSMFEFKKRTEAARLEYLEEIRQKNRTKNIILVSALFILIIAGGLWSRLQYVRKSKSELQNEKNISESLLLNILPHEIAQELKEKGKAAARNFDTVSILFTDFKDFTEQSAKLSATDLVSEISHCFEAFDGIMEKYSIEKIKTIGDAYMAAGGLPVPTEYSAKNTVLAALEIQEFIIHRKNEMDSQNKPAFEMRLGIHTGPVVAGIVGVKKFQYDIWGDTVNTAARMESSGEVGKVNISQKTYELLKSDTTFTFESRGKIEVKGKGEMEMYFVELKIE